VLKGTKAMKNYFDETEVKEELVDKIDNSKIDQLNKQLSAKYQILLCISWDQNRASIFSSLPRDSFL
jgi:hypothetical protein